MVVANRIRQLCSTAPGIPYRLGIGKVLTHGQRAHLEPLTTEYVHVDTCDFFPPSSYQDYVLSWNKGLESTPWSYSVGHRAATILLPKNVDNGPHNPVSPKYFMHLNTTKIV